jgi:general secretion pathway protein K
MKTNQNGVALVVVLGVISVLLVTGLHLSKITTESVTTAQQRTDQFTAREMALSAIHLAMAILAKDAAQTDMDSIQETWADPDIVAEMVDQLGYSQGRINLDITDELGKIQVNSLLRQFPGHEVNQDQRALWERLLSLHMESHQTKTGLHPEAVVNALVDWLDSGDDGAVSGLSGAESDAYARLPVPYTCADKEFDHLSEMLNVKGFSPELFSFQQTPPDPEESEKNEVKTWKDLFTVYGLSDEPSEGKSYRYHGLININTAGLEVIHALLPLGMAEFAQDLLDYRAQKSEDEKMFVNSLDKGWFSRVIGLSPKERETFDRMIRYNSHMFKVTATVQLNRTRIRLSAYIQRERQAKSRRWICRINQLERN